MKNSIFYILLILLAPLALAVEVTDLYQYKAVVNDKSVAEQKRANKVGFLGVLKKVSGQSIDPSLPAIVEASRNLSRFVMKYEFEESLYQTYLTIRYQPQMINAVLNESELPIWGNRRPLTLIWLAVEENIQRALVTKEDYPQIDHLLATNSTNAGLPIVLPLLDLEDRMAVSVSDVWANFPQQIMRASSRYEPEVIVSARLYQRDNVWLLDWQFTNQESFKITRLKGDKLTIVGQLVDSIAEQIAAQHAALSPQDEFHQVTIRFNGVNGLQQVAALNKRLQSFNQVTSLDIKYRRAQYIDITLYLNASIESLKKALQLDPQFEQDIDPFNYEQDKPLEYQWFNQ